MSGGGGTTVQSSQPWSGVQPYLTQGYSAAQDLYNQGGPQYYPGSTYAGLSGQSQDAAAALSALSNGSNIVNAGNANALDLMNGGAALGTNFTNALSPISGYLGNIATSNGLGNFTSGAIGDLTATGGAANPQFRADTGGIISGLSQALNPANSTLSMIANGGMVGSNPYLSSMYDSAADALTRNFSKAVVPGIQGGAEAAGRYGSGAMTSQIGDAYNTLGKSLSDLGTNLYGNAYQGDTGNMLSAAGTLGNLYQSGLGLQASTAATAGGLTGQDVGNRLASTGQITGAMGQDTANQLAALGQATNVQSLINQQNNQDIATRLAAMGQIPSLTNANIANLTAGAQGGAMVDQDMQNSLNADIQRYNYNQQLPYNNLAQYFSFLNGGGNTGGMTTTTQNGSALSTAGGILGGGASAAQIGLALQKLGYLP